MTQDLQEKLSRVLAARIDGFGSLTSCDQLSAGASQETWRVACDCSGGPRVFALRRAQPTASAGSGVGVISLETEAKLFQLANRGGVPGPEVLHVLGAEDGLGSGFLMQWLEGETLGQRIVRAEEFAAVRPQLARQCGEILGRLHRLDLGAGELRDALPTVEPATLVRETWSYYRDLEVPVPMIDYCWRWLQDNLPAAHRTTLVHGDFRNGNLMVTPQGINAVLDWELAHIGDPLRDLGWLCVNSWRFGKSNLPVGGFGEIDDLLDGYRDTSGVEVSAQQLLFWQVFGSFWWSMATLQMASTWRSGETPSLERPVIGRRSSEAQMDCANLLLPGDFDLPERATDLARGTQLPMPAELLEGVRSFLKEDAAPGLDPHSGFLARVAANSLGIAQRELLHGPSLAQAELARLQALLGTTGELDTLRWELVDRLRGGMALDTPGLAEHLRQTVAGQLFIDQPRYSALQPQQAAD